MAFAAGQAHLDLSHGNSVAIALHHEQRRHQADLFMAFGAGIGLAMHGAVEYDLSRALSRVRDLGADRHCLGVRHEK